MKNIIVTYKTSMTKLQKIIDLRVIFSNKIVFM